MKDEWLEKHVERRLHAEHLARLDAYIEGDGSGAERADVAVVRDELRTRLQSQLEQPVPDKLIGIGNFFQDLRDDYPDPDKRDEQYFRERDAAIRNWNAVWAALTNHGKNLPPSMSGWSFHMFDLPGVNLTNADLRASEDGRTPKHIGTDFREAIFRGANLAGNDIAEACLEGADLTDAYLVGASLTGANLRGANLERADLSKAYLQGADLTGAKLRYASLIGADMHGAKLDHADLSFTRGLMLDENSVYRTKFTNRAGIIWKAFIYAYFALQWVLTRVRLLGWHEREEFPQIEDAWSSLRRVYTGPNFFLTLLFLVAFIVPYLAKAFILSEVSQAESLVLSKLSVVTAQDLSQSPLNAAEVEDLRNQLPKEYQALKRSFEMALQSAGDASVRAGKLAVGPDAVSVEATRQSVAQTLDRMNALDAQVNDFRRDVGRWSAGVAQARRYPIWYILLGLDTGHYAWTLLICLLLVYNGLKGFLTITIAPMRDAEERSWITPAKPEYQRLLPLHRIVSVLSWLSLALSMFNWYQWMTRPVYKVW